MCSTPTAPGVARSFGSLRLNVARVSQAHCINRRIDDTLMAPGQAAQLARQREGDQEVAARHQRLQSAARSRRWLSKCWQCGQARWPQECGTRRCSPQPVHWASMRGAKAGAAALHGLERLVLAGQQAVLGQVLGLEAADDVARACEAFVVIMTRADADHFTAPQPRLKRLIRASMRSVASASLWLVRWV